jgi:hypothetical protein
MRALSGLSLFATLLLIVAACGANTAPPPSGTATPSAAPAAPNVDNQIAPTPTPILLTRSNPLLEKIPLTQACNLVTRQDVGGFFGAEVNQPLYQLNHADQVIFPAAAISTTESYCVYMAFHQPSSRNGAYYQVTYWVDTPDRATPAEWAQTWAQGKSHASQTISGIGEDAFYGDGLLTFRVGSTFVTVEVIGTRIDTSTAAGVSAQIEIEKKVALKALTRMTN